MLTVGASRQCVVFGLLCQIRQHGENPGQLGQINAMGLSKHQQLACLGDVLSRCAPMSPPSAIAVAHPVQFPDQRDKRMACFGEPFVNGINVQKG